MLIAPLLAALVLGGSAPGADPIVGFWQFKGGIIQVQGPGRDGMFFGLTMGVNPTYFDTCAHPPGQVLWEISGGGGIYTGRHAGFRNTETCNFTETNWLPAAWSVSGDRMEVRIGPEGGTAGSCGSAGTNCYVFTRVAGPSSPSAKDTTSPTVTALPSTGKRGGTTTLRFRAKDDSGTTRIAIELVRGGRVIGTAKTAFGKAKGSLSILRFRTPAGLAGSYTWCATAEDRAGNRSGRSCAALRVT